MSFDRNHITTLIKKKSFQFWSILSVLLVAFAGIKSYHEGMDADVYLYASKQLYAGENIYANNPFNFYLYSPFFAFVLWPFSVLGEFGRAAWGMFNMLLFLRLAYTFSEVLLSSANTSKVIRRWWYAGAIVMSFGMTLHNVSLGQITILILWLTFEGLYQITIKQKKILGAILLGLGVIIKIIPILGVFYLGLKKEFKSVVIAGTTVILCLFLPSLYTGINENNELLMSWEETINPSKDKYVFEFDNGTYSLNAVLPAYLYDFEGNQVTPPTNRPRQIIALSDNALMIFLQTLRIALALGLVYFAFYKRKERDNSSLFFIWEFAYLGLITALIFPHQQKYAMLYFVPCGAYFLFYFLISLKRNWDDNKLHKTIGIISMGILLLFSIQGRDIIGNPATELLDDYHTFGLINLFSIFILLYLKPDKLEIEQTK